MARYNAPKLGAKYTWKLSYCKSRSMSLEIFPTATQF